MKAIYITQGGNSRALHAGELPTPEIQHNKQILVKIQAAGVNPIDTKIRNSPERFPVTLPAIPGCDAAGIVQAVGSNITNFKPGDEVYFSQPGFNNRQGTYAEYVTVDASLVALKPENLSFEQAASMPLVFITAWEALYDRAGMKTGQKILIHAGAGGVGHIAVQLAKIAGTEVCTTVSTNKKANFVKQLGADNIVLYKNNPVQEAIMTWTGNEGVDIAFDTVGGPVLESCFACTKVYGDVVTLLQPDVNINWTEARKRNLRFSMELMLSPVMLELEKAKQHQGNILRQCTELFEAGKLQTPHIKVYSLADAANAHDYLEQQHPMGKVVLTID
ncbi:MAG: zinc-dependent alcohol dehydrogenase family protein [Gammaproteobacteria bacterium]|nr:zinc-dependent alcohol dehydrogenase family protein [Gammaproteobacteria bacterium]